ncbi:TetR/AcrR family transcriptional regulator [Paenibacillus sp. N1-5-1-14]|uniref:TetR/AcrR family transcriptional regulator n=1 Tax=Paenibacillus radicibacter TaxID=2972488 RepID=UPI002158D832|nr:TetR/AcrR family transcriptional regulator [Paenibacillus radicibacter]MCR8644266.1 TetR/AcrR family transcriptional regulator [Paenibacillus radicibacter]
MPRTPEENERIRTIAKDKIRTAAIDVFIEKGFHKASIDDVAKKASISKGLMYNYYKGKTDLLAELVQVRMDEIVQVMEEAMKLPTPKEQLHYIAENSIRNVQEKPHVYRFYLNLQTHPEADEIVSVYSQQLKDEMAHHSKTQVEIFRNLNAPNPWLASLHFSTALHGIMLMYASYPDNFPLEELRHDMVTSFIDQY